MLSLFRCVSIVEMDQRKGMRSRLTLWELSGGPFGGVPFFFFARPTYHPRVSDHYPETPW